MVDNKELNLTIPSRIGGTESSTRAKISGVIKIPGDKSITHRAIIFASIANVPITIKNWLKSKDCIATLKAINAMGITSYEMKLDASVLTINGKGITGLQKPNKILDLGNSGTGIRLLTGLLSGQKFATTLTGDSSLLKRPMQRIIEPLQLMGADVVNTAGFAPIHINPVANLKPINYKLPIASAQVKSAVLLAGLYANKQSNLSQSHSTCKTDIATKVVDCFNSRDHTERMFDYMHSHLQECPNSIEIKDTEDSIDVPGDISSAAFFIVAALICPDSNLTVHNIGVNPTRTGIITILKAMGASIIIINEKIINNEPRATIKVKTSQLKGITVSPEIIPKAIDEFPIIFIAAACANGITIITGLDELKYKESNRINSMIVGMQKLGVDISIYKDGVKIIGRGSQRTINNIVDNNVSRTDSLFNGGEVDSFGDHRVAMAFAIAGLVAKDKVIIKNCANIATSFPGFYEIMGQICRQHQSQKS